MTGDFPPGLGDASAKQLSKRELEAVGACPNRYDAMGSGICATQYHQGPQPKRFSPAAKGKNVVSLSMYSELRFASSA